MKHTKFKKCLAFLVMFLITFTQLTILPKAAEKTDKKNIVVYFPNWGTYNAAHNTMSVDQIPWDKVTVVNHAFFEVDSQFKLASTDSYADFDKSFPHSEGWDTNQLRGHMGEYKYYKSLYPNVKILISVGGWTRGENFHAMASSSTSRAIFINSVVNFLKQYPFIDGIDIDWEFPGIDRKADPNDSNDKGCPGGPEDKENFTSLLREIREAYNNNGLSNKMLTIAAPAGYDKAQLTEPNIYAQYLDFLNVMTYDIHGAWENTTNHHSALYANPNDPSPTSPVDIKNKYNTDSSMKLYRDTYNIPANKLNVGTPFYSRGWKNVINNGGSLPGLFASANGAPIGSWDSPQSPGGQNPYFKMKELENTSGYVKYRDPYAKVPYLYNASEGIMYSYEDQESLSEKCDYVLNNGFGGMIAWEISGDDPNGFPLTSIMASKFNINNTPTEPSNPTDPTNPTTYPAWDSSKAYVSGDIVSYNGNDYKAKWWTQGDTPGSSDVWQLMGSDTTTPTNPTNPTTYPAWDSSKVYVGGNIVSYNGSDYKAKWWTQGDTPGSSDVWQLIGPNNSKFTSSITINTTTLSAAHYLDTENTSANSITSTGSTTYPSWDNSKAYVGGDIVSYNGNDYKAKWWTQGDTPGSSDVWQLMGSDTTTPTNPTNPITYPAWDSSKAYVGGDVVSYNGNDYKAKWWTQGDTPGSSDVWQLIGPDSSTPTDPAPPTDPTTPNNPSTPSGSRMFVGYAGTWNTSINDLTTTIIPNYYTNINLAFAKPDTTYKKGSYNFDQQVAGLEFVEGATTNNGQNKFTAAQAATLRNNIAALKARGTQVWLSIGGWSYSQGSSWSNFNPSNVVDLALDLGASGIDIDWEVEGASCNKQTSDTFACSSDAQIKNILDRLYDEIHSRGANLGISMAGWSTGAYYVKGSPFEEGKVQWGSPFGGVLYRVVKDEGSKLNYINLMSYDGGEYYDPREGYESYRAIYSGPINMGIEIAPEGAGGALLKLNADPGTVYDAEMLTGQNNIATKYYNVETLVNYIKNKGHSNDGFMVWQIWKERVYGPAPSGAATVNSAGQYVCRNLPLSGDAEQSIPNLPKD